MAVTPSRYGPYPPDAPNQNQNAQHPTGVTLDGAGEYIALITPPPKAGNLRKIKARITTVTTPGDLAFNVESVNAADGMPSGSLFGTNTGATVSYSAANAWYTATLTADAAVTRETPIAIVLRWVSGNCVVQLGRSGMNSNYPYKVTNTGTPTKSAGGDYPEIILEYSDGSIVHIPATLPGVIVASNYTTATTPDEIGLAWTPAVSRSVCGARVFGNFANDFEVVLYDTDGTTELEKVAFDKDICGSAAGTMDLLFNADVQVNAGSMYRLVYKPGASNVNIAVLTVPSAADRDATPWGTEFQKTSRADAGAWTEVDTDLVMIFPLVNGIYLSAAGRRIRING